MATAQERFETDKKFTYRALQDARQYVTDVDRTGAKAEALYARLAKANRLMYPWSTDGNAAQSKKAIEYIKEITSILSDKIGPASRREFREQGGRRDHATKLADVVYETDQYWVKRAAKGFEVYKIGPTSSTRVAVIGYPGDKGLQRAKDEIARREAATGTSHATKKSPAQLQREIDDVLDKRRSHAIAWTPRSEEVTSTAGLMKIAAAVARELKQSGMTWGDTSRGRGRAVRIWSSGSSVRFEVPSRFQGAPSDAQAIVDLHLVGPDRSNTSVGPFAGDMHYDKRFGEAMEQRVRQVLKKGTR